MKLSDRDVRHLSICARRNPFTTAEKLKCDLAEHGSTPVSSRTVRRYLRRLKLRCRKAKSKPLLTVFQRHRRVIWAKKLVRKPLSFWKKCIFSDETRICMLDGTAHHYVYRANGEADLPQHIRANVKHCPSVTIWGCFSSKGVGRLRFVGGQERMNSVWYLNVLEDEVLGTMHEQFGSPSHCYFQDDGAPCHRSRIVTNKCLQMGFKCLKWVGQSPDCNPIENLWSLLKRQIRVINPRTVADLKQTIQTVWSNGITQEYCHALCLSMPRRMASVIKNKGFSTKY